jgi:hypothetical protein
MSIQYYLRKNPFGTGKKFFARTIVKNQITEEKLLDRMAGKGTAMTPTELRGVLDLLKKTIEELLMEGNLVQLNNFMELYPSINSSSDFSDRGFNHNVGNINLRCRLNNTLVKKIRSNILVERLDNEKKMPKIITVRSGNERENAIRWPYSTTLRGNNLKQSGRDIKGIKIISQENSENFIIIPAENLVLDTMGSKELSFSISHEITIPSWLISGLPVFLLIEYTGENEQLAIQSLPVKTFWLIQPETAETEVTTDNEENISTEETIN